MNCPYNRLFNNMTKYYKKSGVIVFLAAIALLTAAGCNEDSVLVPEKSGIFKVVSITSPDTVWVKKRIVFIVTAQVENVNIDEPVAVAGTIQFEHLPGFCMFFRLYDDGRRADNIPGDNLYTTYLSSTIFMGHKGTAIVTIFGSFSLHEPYFQSGVPLTINIAVIDGYLNTPPILSDLTAPDFVRYDLSDFTLITVQAADAQGLDDIVTVTGLLFPPYSPTPDLNIAFRDDGAENDISAGDGISTGVILHDAIALTGRGDYTLLAYALDKAGNKSNEEIHTINFDSEIIEIPPEIKNVTAPDSIEAGSDPVLLHVEVYDVNGLSHIESVYFYSVKPDGSLANNGNPFFLYDDGGTFSGDLAAGDGIYSLTILIPYGTINGTYFFKFRVIDKIGLMSPFHEHTVTVY